MKENNVKNFVFSSSATVYGNPKYLPIDEKHTTDGDQITNPYGKSKFIVEHILKDLAASDKVIWYKNFIKIKLLKHFKFYSINRPGTL